MAVEKGENAFQKSLQFLQGITIDPILMLIERAGDMMGGATSSVFGSAGATLVNGLDALTGNNGQPVSQSSSDIVPIKDASFTPSPVTVRSQEELVSMIPENVRKMADQAMQYVSGSAKQVYASVTSPSESLLMQHNATIGAPMPSGPDRSIGFS